MLIPIYSGVFVCNDHTVIYNIIGQYLKDHDISEVCHISVTLAAPQPNTKSPYIFCVSSDYSTLELNNSKYEVTIKTEDENYYRSDIIKLHIPSMDNITSVNIDGDVSCIICETVLLSMMRFGTHKLYCPDTDESMLNDIISSLMFKRLTRATRRLTTEQCPITYNLIGEKEFYYKCLSCNNEFEQLPSINGHFDIQNQTPNVLYAQIC